MKTEAQLADHTAYMRQWRLKHPEMDKATRQRGAVKRRESTKKWMIANPKWIVAYRRKRLVQRREYLNKWRTANPEKYKAQWTRRMAKPEAKEYARQRYLAQRERHLELGKIWTANNRDKRSVIEKTWREKNREKYLTFKHARRAKTRPTLEVLAKVKLLFLERFCRWCCTHLTTKNRSIDHVIPLARGGQHIADNLAASCKKCNSSRNDKLVSEWLPFQNFERI